MGKAVESAARALFQWFKLSDHFYDRSERRKALLQISVENPEKLGLKSHPEQWVVPGIGWIGGAID